MENDITDIITHMCMAYAVAEVPKDVPIKLPIQVWTDLAAECDSKFVHSSVFAGGCGRLIIHGREVVSF